MCMTDDSEAAETRVRDRATVEHDLARSMKLYQLADRMRARRLRREGMDVPAFGGA